MLQLGSPARLEVRVNGAPAGQFVLDRPGLFVFELPVPPAPDYLVEVLAGPTFQVPPDERVFTVNLSMMRLTSALS
jgi:hypothetical protein